MRRHRLNTHRGRHLVALFMSLPIISLMAGCAGLESTPVAGILPGLGSEGERIEDRARELPFASISLDAGDRSGLVVLGSLVGPFSFWPTGDGGMVAFRHEQLQATGGLLADLLGSHYTPLAPSPDSSDFAPWREPAPPDFRVTRSWQTEEGLVHHLSATGNLSCATPRYHDLPLERRLLQPCQETLHWQNGSTTHSTLWRDPEDFRLWAAEVIAWPQGPRIEWQVARPWW